MFGRVVHANLYTKATLNGQNIDDLLTDAERAHKTVLVLA